MKVLIAFAGKSKSHIFGVKNSEVSLYVGLLGRLIYFSLNYFGPINKHTKQPTNTTNWACDIKSTIILSYHMHIFIFFCLHFRWISANVRSEEENMVW